MADTQLVLRKTYCPFSKRQCQGLCLQGRCVVQDVLPLRFIHTEIPIWFIFSLSTLKGWREVIPPSLTSLCYSPVTITSSGTTRYLIHETHAVRQQKGFCGGNHSYKNQHKEWCLQWSACQNQSHQTNPNSIRDCLHHMVDFYNFVCTVKSLFDTPPTNRFQL